MWLVPVRLGRVRAEQVAAVRETSLVRAVEQDQVVWGQGLDGCSGEFSNCGPWVGWGEDAPMVR